MRRNSYAVIFASLFLLLYFSTSEVQAESKQIYQVGTDNLNVRKSPDFDAEVVGKLQAGNQIAVFQEKHGWVQTYYDGQAVWVASQYLFEVEETSSKQQASSASSNSVTIKEDAVHLRSGTGTNHKILAIASKGDTYNLVKTSNDWHQIKLTDGTTAWVASWLTDQPTTTKQATNTNSKSKSSSNNSSKSKASSSSSNQSLVGYNIMLDPSHGGIDPGAIGLNGEKEKDLALEFTHVVAEKLRNEGATVLLTRSADHYVSLEDRVRISEAYMTDAFISLHFNAFTSGTSNGVSTHYYSNKTDYALAEQIQTSLERHTTLHSRGVRNDDYYVLRKNSHTSVLVELGFLTNPSDLAVIRSSDYSSDVANAIAEGLSNYLN